MSAAPQISEAQLHANRANAQKSTGPRTADGKTRSRLNAFTHGLTSQTACMSYEDRDAFDKFCAATVDAWKPEGLLETQLAQAIAEDRWRLNRIRAIENNIFALGQSSLDIDATGTDCALNQAATFLADAKSFALLTLYEQRIGRNVRKNEEALRTLQAERKAAFEKALAETQLLADLALSKGEIYDAGPDFKSVYGFDFSALEIDRLIRRNRRLNEAKALAKAGENHAKPLRKAA